MLSVLCLGLHAQSEDQAIRSALQGYIYGTTFNDADTVLSSFMPGAPMYLENTRTKELVILTIEEYTVGIRKREPGVDNGRRTHILSIDFFEHIATAKLEVFISGMDRRFIDYLILRKNDGAWKIISKTATSVPIEGYRDLKALIVLSSAAYQGNSDLPAGNSFSEVAVAYDEYKKAGFHVDFVSPSGGQVPLAYINAGDPFQMDYLMYSDFMYALKHTRSPAQINPDDYQIVQFTGGSAPIFDLPHHHAIQEIAMHIYEKNNGVIAAVCHGSAAIAYLKESDGDYLVKGKVVNGFPDSHERKDLPHYSQYPFILEQVLKEHGADFKYGEKGSAHVEVDGRLVTGQNFQSSALATKKSVEAYFEYNE